MQDEARARGIALRLRRIPREVMDPDFVVRMVDGAHLVLETKGLVDLDVPAKDARAQRWATEASAAAGVAWRYHRVDEAIFDSYADQVGSLGGLLDVVGARTREALRAALPTPRRRAREELVALMDATVAKTLGSTGADESLRQLREDPRAG